MWTSILYSKWLVIGAVVVLVVSLGFTAKNIFFPSSVTLAQALANSNGFECTYEDSDPVWVRWQDGRITASEWPDDVDVVYSLEGDSLTIEQQGEGGPPTTITIEGLSAVVIDPSETYSISDGYSTLVAQISPGESETGPAAADPTICRVL